jgi:hypothetical protein
MTKGFIQRSDLLEETSRVEDLLDFSVLSQKLVKKIEALQGLYIIALVGPFGVGKSTMLNQIISERQAEKWIEFDAWKYPDRSDLWEGFVLDIARSISPKEFEKTEKKVKGTQNDDKKALVSVLSKIPGFSALEGFNHFLQTSPARRVDEIQSILKEQIELFDKDLFIVIEDIDRSGDSGVFFLETLKQFLRNQPFKHKVCVIVPIADDNYHKNLDSYLKCIDYFEFFELPEIQLERYVSEVFDQTIFDEVNKKTQTVSFLEGLFKEFPKMTMRMLKLILRKADLVYRNQSEDGFAPDFRVTLCIEASKYFNKGDDSPQKYFDDFKQRGAVVRGNIFSAFLTAIFSKERSLYREQYDSGGESRKELLQPRMDFKFVERNPKENIKSFPSSPWSFGQFQDDRGFGITGFYKDY